MFTCPEHQIEFTDYCELCYPITQEEINLAHRDAMRTLATMLGMDFPLPLCGVIVA